MIDGLVKDIEKTYAEIAEQLGDPAVLGDRKRYAEVARRHAELQASHELAREYREAQQQIAEAQELLSSKDGIDADMRDYLEAELAAGHVRLEALAEEIRVAMLVRDANDSKNVILEVRAGAGGDEAALFAAELFRMYQRYAERKGYQVEVLSANESSTGGFKEVIAEIRGQGVYSALKFESGVHRVQRVPVTEAAGRIHTSTATVAVLPEAEEIDVQIDPNDLRIDIFRSSGPGGQSVNTTDSAVRVTHLPSGLVVSCQDEKSQLQNRERALRILRARLYELVQREQEQELAEQRRTLVGSGDRAQKIRTYNFPQNRVSDHRIGLTSHRLTDVLAGDIEEFTEALAAEERRKRLASLASE
ncbi:MAG: peptide chain release factor 1 [Actinobacteria bacterium]|nr:peptide chain release factor 1 [Actinomycetota bacterium]